MLQENAERFDSFVLTSLERRQVKVRRLSKGFRAGIWRTALSASREAHADLGYFNSRSFSTTEDELDSLFLAMRDRQVPAFLENFHRRHTTPDEAVEAAQESERVTALLKDGHLGGKTLESILAGVGVAFTPTGRPLEDFFNER